MAADDRILVIRLGALGDLVLCFQAFHEIRDAHPQVQIALMTMPAFSDFARLMPWFDRIIVDVRAPARNLSQWWGLLQTVRRFNPDRVYDLQGKTRQNILYGLLGGPWHGPQWSGAAPFCSHPRLWPPVPGMHFTDFVAAQLRAAGVPARPPVDLKWLDAPVDSFALPARYVLLIPGCAPGRDYKRWPAAHYVALARRLRDQGIASVAVGTKQDAAVIAEMTKATPDIVSLCGRTSLHQLAGLARRSVGVIGNDTGPTHLAAAVGAPTVALFSEQVDPVWSAPRGPRVAWRQGKPLERLGVDEVLLALNALIDTNA